MGEEGVGSPARGGNISGQISQGREGDQRQLEGGGLKMFCQERAEESWVGDQAAHNRSRQFIFLKHLRVKTPVVMICGVGEFFFQGSTPIFPLPI